MKYLQRYTEGERSLHWAVALLFILAALSGFAFFHPSLFWLVNFFGGGPWTRILHPFLGIAMALAFAYMAWQFWEHNKLSPQDSNWLKQWRDVIGNREDRLPEAGKYNAGQKVLFWVLIVCLATLVLTGIVYWRSMFPDFPVWLVRLASLLHALAATVLVIAIIVHSYAAFWVKGSLRAMLRGTVSEAWAKKHHPAWHREMNR
ncbi:MAG TPA: formate dehydrogenase subunit gamma [Burkholderiales bacterium]|jgi:formate dehydrogenase subunit gamma